MEQWESGRLLGMAFLKKVQAVLRETPVEELCPFIHAFEYNPPLLSPVIPGNDPSVSDFHLTLVNQTSQFLRAVRLSSLWQMCRRTDCDISTILGPGDESGLLQEHPFFVDYLLGLNVTWVLDKVRKCVPEKSFYLRMLLVLSLIDPELSLLESNQNIYPKARKDQFYPLLNEAFGRVLESREEHAYSLMQLVAEFNNQACARALVQWVGTQGETSGDSVGRLVDEVLCVSPPPENIRFAERNKSPFEMCVRLGHMNVLAPFLPVTEVPAFLLEPRRSLEGLSLFQAASKGPNPTVLRCMLNMMPPEIRRQALRSKTADKKGMSVFHICCSTPAADTYRTFSELYNAAEALGVDIYGLRDKAGRSVFYACPTTSISYLETLKTGFDRERDIELVGLRPSLFHFFFPEHLNPIPNTVPISDGLVSPLFLVGQVKVNRTRDSNSEVRRAAHLLIERGADPSASNEGKGSLVSLDASRASEGVVVQTPYADGDGRPACVCEGKNRRQQSVCVSSERC
uniref:Uncharacterized protein n=1 Tax=Chromera velia CCMP2878 TaxID=1169474 RepID=A0A0G4FT97_9ALVE|eukprot:Cvel_18646.t1-p1 / transcript=Cvel_18646.t1 / gene=Cvel_18646 / organism=Chromera_velia_CCMP2878 / gene_product=hypothetical protein / transcript_product=hypothetical protein / location=Cvel_scaffold1557:39855-41393(-) / protein_length=513 / sequence_SO=supercontig / SO=protein_coding / is_pseudo=false